MNRVAITASVFVVMLLLTGISGCTFVLPESQQPPSNATQTSASNANLTINVQSLGEQQRYSLSPVISYTAKEGYKLALYAVSITNRDGAVAAGDTTFFTLAVDNETTYDAVLTSISARVIQSGESLSGTVIFEVPSSAVPRELQYTDGANRVIIGV